MTQKNYKKLLLQIILLSSISCAANAETHPFASIALGSDRADLSNNTNITLIPPLYNSYVGANTYDTEMLGGIFIGAESDVNPQIKWDYGVSYYQNSSFQAHGMVYQFGNANFANLNYFYQIQSRRFLLETKVLCTLQKIFHPYFDLGAGEAINKAYNYVELPITSADVPMSQPFANKTSRQFTYLAGFGLDIDIYPKVRLGAGYRYVNLGNAGLNPSPLQQDSHTIENNNLKTNEFLLQLTYLS